MDDRSSRRCFETESGSFKYIGRMSRRLFLNAAHVLILLVFIVGLSFFACTGDDDDDSEATPTATSTPVPTETPNEQPTATPTPEFGCNPVTREGWISTGFGLSFSMNCFESQNVYNDKPHTNITWLEAKNACLSQSKRLCSVVEFQAACSGPRGYDYPYGPTYDPVMCWTNKDPYSGPFRSGSKPGCVSDYGIYDMSGNVSELSSDEVPGNSGYYYKLGGDWAESGEYGCYDQKEWHENAVNIWTGYRCCRDPDNATQDSGTILNRAHRTFVVVDPDKR